MPGNVASGIFFVNSEQNNNAMKKIWAYILPTALCFVLGGLAGWLQQDAIEEWYPLLDKPTLTPQWTKYSHTGNTCGPSM